MTSIFNIEVEDKEVRELLEDVRLAISPLSLVEFLQEDATEFFRNDIESRFNEEGDVKSGFWAPLAESTVQIREQLGVGGSEPINRRTDEMFDFLMGPYQIFVGGSWVEMQVPGDPPDPITERKLEVATKGTSQNSLFPNSYTPPRPVLAFSEMDMATLLQKLEFHIIYKIIGSVTI